MEWRSRVREKKRKKVLWSAQTPQILFEEMGRVGVGGRSKVRDGEFSLLFQSPAGTLLQRQHCPLCTPLLGCSNSHWDDSGANRSLV